MSSPPSGNGSITEESNNQLRAGNSSTFKGRKSLLKRQITLSVAEDEEEDMRAELQYVTKRAELYTELDIKRKEIQSIVASHCGLASPEFVQVPKMVDDQGLIIWIHGSFNACIPVSIDNTGLALPARLGFRVPLPYKIGEEAYPGNAEEKLRSEVATYIWIDENCPDIPIPRLRGFGVPGGLSFYSPESLPFWQRFKFYTWRLFSSVLGKPRSCEYISQKRTSFLKHGYMLVDWIESDHGSMLSNTLSRPHTETQTRNLYRDMAKIIISLARIPQHRIGSWTINNDGQLSLSNRPMFCHLYQLENWSIPTDIPRDITYTNADSLYLDLLTGHDNRLRYQANAAFDNIDARGQAKDLVLMRALLHQFTDRSLRNGPFVMQLTDMHASNIFVDEDWNIKYIIDLEWACSLPVETLLPPFWLTNKGVDQLEDEEYERFKICYEKFTEMLKQEESKAPLYYMGNHYSLATIMDSALESGRYWYLSALTTPKGLFNLFRRHIASFYDKVPVESLEEAISPFWTRGMSAFVDMKLDEFAQYRQEVRDIFNSNKSGKLHY